MSEAGGGRQEAGGRRQDVVGKKLSTVSACAYDVRCSSSEGFSGLL
jgi:hypothetical protein